VVGRHLGRHTGEPIEAEEDTKDSDDTEEKTGSRQAEPEAVLSYRLHQLPAAMTHPVKEARYWHETDYSE
jgi:hypothetical protein